MSFPPPPPPGQRFYQFFTSQGQQAVEQGSGPLYGLLVDTILIMNPDCFDNAAQVQTVLLKMIWPPNNVEELFNDFPHIPNIATHLRLVEDGFWIPIFEADLQRWTEISAARVSFKVAFCEQFGSVERFRILRKQFVAEGSTAEQFDQQLRALVKNSEKRIIRPWWKFW